MSAAPAESGHDPDLPWLRRDLTWLRPVSGMPVTGPQRRSALFLDRDGVIIEDRHYLADPDGVVLLPGAAAAIRQARSEGQAVVVVTNQSGIARGLFGWRDHRAVEDRMLELLGRDGATVDMILACGHHPMGRPPYDRVHEWRKPGAGMLREAARVLDLDLSTSLLVGDKATDIEAARAAGVPRAVLVTSRHDSRELQAARLLESTAFAVDASASLERAIVAPPWA